MDRFYSHSVLSVWETERPITVDEAIALRLLIFGNLKDSFRDAWTKQSFNFRSVPPYGFHQKKPGPCGVLAAVQGFVIYELFFGASLIGSTSELLMSEKKRMALSRALATIIWQAGDGYSASVCVKRRSLALSSDEALAILKRDGITEFVHLIYFDCQNCLQEYLCNFMSQELEGGCILLLYSLIFSRGIEKIKKDMDDPKNHLIGEDGYCSQEVVNLILIGRAVPNLFDGDMELNSGGTETTIHHGIPKKSKIGLLSLYDYQDTSPVGNHYKQPISPIWVLVGQNHFTVLFCATDEPELKEDCFTLYHYDGFAKHHAETAYLIKPYENSTELPKDTTLTVVEQCIFTRWPQASITEKYRH